MKSPPRLRIFVAPLLAAALLASAAHAGQTKPRQSAPARAGAQRAKPGSPTQPPRPATPQPTRPAARTPAEIADPAGAAGVTLDELFAADAYAVYGELRMVGQHFASEEFRQLVEPLKLAGVAPPDIVEMYEFVASQAEQLASARVAFAGVPNKAGLPTVVAAVELPSSEEASKFAPQLREFIAKSGLFGGGAAGEGVQVEAVELVEPIPAGLPEAETARRVDAPRRRRGRGRASANNAATRTNAAVKEAALPFHVKQSGSVVALAGSPFTFAKLRGAADAPALAQERGFAAARARLATETVFLYFNTARMNAATRRQVEEIEREHQRIADGEQALRERDMKSGANSAANSNSAGGVGVLSGPAGQSNANANTNVGDGARKANANDAAVPMVEDAEVAAHLADIEAQIARNEEALKKQTPEEQARRREAERQREFENQLGSLIFDGGLFGSPGQPAAGGSWPESIGVGAAFEGDSIVVRAFLVADSENRPPRPIPFMPLLHAGPQVASEAVNVLPADTDVLVSASLDLPQMYGYVASVFKLFDLAASAAGEADKQGLFDSQIGAFERRLKFKIREDLINALGNELAVALPGETFGVRRGRTTASVETTTAADGSVSAAVVDAPSPVFVIALKDKRAVQALLPRALEAIGVAGVSEQQLLQKQGQAELVTFAQGSVAFIDNFLVVAFDAASVKRVVDAYNDGRTLGRSRLYRDPADWQPRQMIGQAYVSSALLKGMFGDAHNSIDDIDDEKLRAHLAALDPEPGAVTLAATRDAAGLTHELHVPKNLLNLWTASSLVSQKLAALRANESSATFALYSLASEQGEYKKVHGRYAASVEELRREFEKESDKNAGLRDDLNAEGYEIKLTASGDKFEATATPTGYPKQGRRSFYIDQTGRLRGGDLGGRPASASSEPVSH